MTVLIAAGETVFLLPFAVARVFRPTFLEVFQITNLQLGTAFALYGFVAMISYFLGGPIADRFSARKLMATALVATSFGGVIFVTVPSLPVLTLLYGFWGLTTILLFWAALIRATRELGGLQAQGSAYGILDGGRGLFVALLASFSVWIFALLLPIDVKTATLAQSTDALVKVIWIYTGIVVLVAVLVWMIVPDEYSKSPKGRSISWAGVKQILKRPSIWLQAVIVVCAYVGYKATDDFSLYVSDAFGYNDVEAAKIGTVSFWVRPLAAVGAGFLADKFSASKMTIVSFGLMMTGSICLSTGFLNGDMYWMLIMIIVTASLGIYALRGIYFALFQESKIPLHITGSAVGLVSFVGFTPEIFMGPLMGFLIDRSPGSLGHQHVFMVLAIFAAIGMIAAILFRSFLRSQQ